MANALIRHVVVVMSGGDLALRRSFGALRLTFVKRRGGAGLGWGARWRFSPRARAWAGAAELGRGRRLGRTGAVVSRRGHDAATEALQFCAEGAAMPQTCCRFSPRVRWGGWRRSRFSPRATGRTEAGAPSTEYGSAAEATSAPSARNGSGGRADRVHSTSFCGVAGGRLTPRSVFAAAATAPAPAPQTLRSSTMFLLVPCAFPQHTPTALPPDAQIGKTSVR